MSNNKSAIAIFRVHQDHEQSREITVQFLYLTVRFVIPPFLPLFSLHCSFPPFLFPVFNSIHVVARVLRPGFRALSPPCLPFDFNYEPLSKNADSNLSPPTLFRWRNYERAALRLFLAREFGGTVNKKITFSRNCWKIGTIER